MTDKLPPPLLALFQPRPPVRYIPPQDTGPEQRASIPSKISGLGAYLTHLQEYKETDEYHPTESWLQVRNRERMEKRERAAAMARSDFEEFKPSEDPKIKGDPAKTLFVGRLAYDTKESDLEREFGRFGPVERIRLVKDETATDSKKKSRGYAFIVFEREKDMKAAYKETDGIRIKDRRIIVDVERGRLVEGWRPRRFGGGLGGRGATKAAAAKPSFGGPTGFSAGSRGGFGGPPRGGGFRGGFRGDRGGYGGRGGIGYHGGSDRGGFGGRQGGYQNGAPPPNAPSGPGGRGGYGGYDDRRNGYGGGRDGGRGGYGAGGGRDQGSGRDRYDDRGSRDDYNPRKRYHDGDSYDDSRPKRRY